MGETEPEPALASYRDRITELIEAGEPFAVGGDTTDDSAGPTADAKSALAAGPLDGAIKPSGSTTGAPIWTPSPDGAGHGYAGAAAHLARCRRGSAERARRGRALWAPPA